MVQIIENNTIYTVRMTVTIIWCNKVIPKKPKKGFLKWKCWRKKL